MRRCARFIVIALALATAACGTISYYTTDLGILRGRVIIMWVAENKFVYVPAPKGPLVFETGLGRRIAPGLMYTDGGSVPRFAQILRGFSPWGFGPAYVIHDWIFFGRHCQIDGRADTRFDDVRTIEFHESAVILAEVIKTLVDQEKVPERVFVTDAISNAVDGGIAFGLWNQPGQCNYVEPRHIATVWNSVLGSNTIPPASWKLSEREIQEAKHYLPRYAPVAAPARISRSMQTN